MTYAFLLYPHANIRYRQSLLQLAVQELSMTLSALGREAEVVPQKMGGAMFLTFEAAKLTERDMRMLSQLASVYMLFEMEDGKLTTLERTHPNYVGEDLPALLKYKGKTNEMLPTRCSRWRWRRARSCLCMTASSLSATRWPGGERR